MKMIDPSVTLIKESNPFKKIERVGRTCYKSEDKITEDSAKKFYEGLVKRHHTAMVEHTTFVFSVDAETYYHLYGYKFLNYTYNGSEDRFLISGNLRALNESGEYVLLKALHDLDPDLVYAPHPVYFEEGYDIMVVDINEIKNLSVEEFMAHAYFTFHFICDRGVTHEIVRHRVASYAQESTRYCNYTKDKFGGELSFVKSADWDDMSDEIKLNYIRVFEISENTYSKLISSGETPQQARAVLPNALKTELIMTANAKEFEHFFNLRSRGTTGAPHPDMKVVADKALALYTYERVNTFGITL